MREVTLKDEVKAQKIEISINKVLISGSVRKSCDFQAKSFIRGLLTPRKKAKNIIKTKHRPVFSSLFISAIELLASLLFQIRLLGYSLDSWLGYWWCNVNSFRDYCRLIRMILIKRADELPKMLND